MRHPVLALLASLALLPACSPASEPGQAPAQAAASATAAPAEREIDRILKVQLAPPVIRTEPGFTATVLVPPGELYDPLTLVPHGDVPGAGLGVRFGPEGSRMLATLKGGGPMMMGGGAGPDANKGAIVSVQADGTIDPTPVLNTPRRPTAIEVAPKDFGAYAGQIFYTDWETERHAPMDQQMPGESALYRIGPDGQAHLVASGFVRPAGIAFVNGAIWVSNINRDRVDMPEGSIVRLEVK